MLDTLLPDSDLTLTPLGAVLLGLAASALFLLLAPRMRRLADRYLYRPAYDARALVREGSRAMGTFADPGRVATAMADLIERALHPENLTILVRIRDRDAFAPLVNRRVDPAATRPTEPVAASSPLIQELSDGTAALVRDHVGTRPGAVDASGVLQSLRTWGAEVAVPVRDGRLIAVILAGPKLSGDSFFADELDLLETLASELAIGLKNAQLYHEIVSIKEYNERLLGRMDSGVIAAREDGVVTTFNPAAERILGIEAARVLGRPLDVLDPAIRGVLRSSLVDQAEAETEVTVGHPEGRVLPLIVHTSALHDHKGEVSGAIAVLNDHSRLKALEEDKRRADRLSALGAMATGIAHEIRNPLVAIKTFARAPARAGRRRGVSLDLRQGGREGNTPHRAAPGPPARARRADGVPAASDRCPGAAGRDARPAPGRGRPAASALHRRDRARPAAGPRRARPAQAALPEPVPERPGGHDRRRHAHGDGPGRP